MDLKIDRQERLEIMRNLLIEGVPERLIRRQLRQGLKLPDGRVLPRLSETTVARDLQEIGEAYRRLADDPAVQEAELAGVVHRLRRIALQAEKRGQFQAAIRANIELAKFVGMRSERWSRAADPAAPPVDVDPDDVWARRAGELRELSDDDLVRELTSVRQRAARAGLDVLEGGRGTG